MYKWIIACIVVLTLSGCGEKTIDASDDKSLKDSLSDISNSLSEDKLKEFNEAIKIVMFKDLDLKNFMFNSKVGGALELSKAKSNLDNKSADEIINEAKAIKLKRQKEQKVKLKADIEKLEEDKKSAQFLQDEIDKIKILSANFNPKKERYYSHTDVYCSIQNNSKYTISYIEFNAELRTDDRKVAWYSTTVFTSIAGGLNPNENKDLEMNVRRYWDRTKYPTDVYLVMTIKSIYDENKKRIYPYNDFTEYDKRKLEQLQKRYKEL